MPKTDDGCAPLSPSHVADLRNFLVLLTTIGERRLTIIFINNFDQNNGGMELGVRQWRI